jgi:WD40 repeat protein
MRERERSRPSKRVLAKFVLAIGLSAGIVVFWLLPAPTRAAQRVVPAEPRIHARRMFSSECQIVWSGPETWDVRFLGSARLLATAGPWNPMTFRDLAGQRPSWTLREVGTVRSGHSPAGLAWPYTFSPDGKRFVGVVGGSSRSLWIWDVPSGQPRRAVGLADRQTLQLGFSADGQRLAVGWFGFGNRDRDPVGMTIFDAATVGERASVRIDDLPREGTYPIVAIPAESGTLATRRTPNALELCDTASARLRAAIAAPTTGGQIGTSDWAFSPDGSALVAQLPEGTVNLWDASTGRRRLRASTAVAARSDRPAFGKNCMAWGDPVVRPFAISPDGMVLAVSDRDGSVQLWDIAKARRSTLLPAPVPAFETSGPILFSPRWSIPGGGGAGCADHPDRSGACHAQARRHPRPPVGPRGSRRTADGVGFAWPTGSHRR